MKVKLIFYLVFTMGFYSNVFSQSIKHHSFTTYYNALLKEPDSVAWDLTPSMVSCGKQIRKSFFARDLTIANSTGPLDYRKSGYDKGHLFSFDDAQCDSIDKKECFLMTNMLPQAHAFNVGDWKALEIQERIWAKTTNLHIIAGGIGTIGQLKSGVNIPKYMYKAILMNGKYTAWIMPNLPGSFGHDYTFWEVDIKTLDAKTGLAL